MSAIQFREFDETDWQTFAGANKPEGAEPLIGEMTLDGEGCLVLVDAEGISVEGVDGSLAFIRLPFRAARHFAATLPANPTRLYLESIGMRIEQPVEAVRS